MIKIRGAREHNLKNIDVDIPHNKMVVITGLSGSGKSSLAFDTLFAEGQRRFVESLSAYARQFLGLMQKPKIDHITGLAPAIAIEQRNTATGLRSTVGTSTDIYDYLRLLYAHIGEPYCPNCGSKIKAQTTDQIIDEILSLPEGEKREILAPVVRGKKGEHKDIIEKAKKAGFVRIRIDGNVVLIEKADSLKLNKNNRHSVEVVVDRVVINKKIRSRLTDSVETALRIGDDRLILAVPASKTENFRKWMPLQKNDILFSKAYACTNCDVGDEFDALVPRLFSFNSPYGACPCCHGLGVNLKNFSEKCPECDGIRLKPYSRAVKVRNTTIVELTDKSVEDCFEFIKNLKFSSTEKKIVGEVCKEVLARLKFLIDVGIGYLTLSRKSGSLSGGEAQRIRLASQIGTGLTGVLYVLDEPTIGLHSRDNQKLLKTLEQLRKLGNTVVMVEHDEEAIRSADYIIDIGPGAGVHGGHVLHQGSVKALLKNKKSVTAEFLTGRRKISMPEKRRKPEKGNYLKIEGVCHNNLKNVSVKFPLKLFTCVTGVSGSGKSSLVTDTLLPALKNKINKSDSYVGKHKNIKGIEKIDKVIVVNQSPIGRTPRSNPATYTGVFSHIRELFASIPEAKISGYTNSRFSFNVSGGRCEACTGTGVKKIEMHFLPDVYVTCEACGGSRYNRETLEIKYRGKTISDVLNMTVEEAALFFVKVPKIKKILTTLVDVGLEYITLGQHATTLSGGEAQRVKLSNELAKRETGKTLYLLDEPTTGLHFADIDKLLGVLQRIVTLGNTVIVIEHNLDVIKCSDHVIDLGPEGGDAGGEIIAEGPPEIIAKKEISYTGQFLKPILKN